MVEKQFNQTVEIALYNVTEKVLAFNGHELPNENPVRQISSNYFIVDINDVIDAKILDHYLKTEFDYRNLNIDYEYAIYDCETDNMVFGSYITQSNRSENKDQKFQKYDEFTYYFGIIFPSKTIYILKSMNVWIISSFVLLTALVFFAYAIFIILKQKRFSEIQKDFINNMTHEFKTPVSTIGISANVLSKPDIALNPERLKNYAGIILDQNKRLENQIEKVLQLARLEKNKIELNIEKIDLTKLIKEVAQNFTVMLNDRNGEFRFNLATEEIIIHADKLHLTNVIYNLIDNAIKYSPQPPYITIVLRKNDKFIELIVSDKGIGIDKQYHKKIFTKFYRVPTGDVHNVKGFGIGLNYVKNIMDYHKWKINFESSPGIGSSFIIQIPA